MAESQENSSPKFELNLEPILISLNLIKNLKDAKADSETPTQYFYKACRVFHGSIIITVIMFLMMSYPIAMIVIGFEYLGQCTIESFIPIWLIVGGSFFLATLLIRIIVNVISFIKGLRGDHTLRFNPFTRFALVVEIFLFAWLICGSVWVFSNNSQVVYNDSTSQSFCPQSCFLFAFWSIILAYIFIPLLTVVILWFLCSIGLGFC